MKIIKEKLEQDNEVHQIIPMTVGNIISLLEFCLKNTYFVFQGRYYEHLEGAAMGSPISPIVTYIFMENFEKTLSTAANHPKLWRGMLMISL